MVYILKEPVGESKGIIVFREKGILETDNVLLRNQLRRLKSRYVTAYFWAWNQEEVDSIPFIDVHFAHPYTVRDFNSEQYRVKMHDMQFVPDYFEDLDFPKRWDLLCIATPTKHKRVSEVLESIKMAMTEDDDFSALLLFPRPKELTDERWDEEVFQLYDQELTEDQKENITLHTPIRTDLDLQPIPKDFLPYLYNSSKFFTLFSEEEGGPKTIAEALICGTPIVVPESFTGGINAYLTESNTQKFSTLNDAKEVFLNIKEERLDFEFDQDYLRKELIASNSVERLESRFEEIFRDMGIPYQGSIDKKGLDSKLAHHEPTLPEKYRSHTARGELKSKTAAYKYIRCHLFGDSIDTRTNINLIIRLKLANEVLVFGSATLQRLDDQLPFPIYDVSRNIYNKVR